MSTSDTVPHWVHTRSPLSASRNTNPLQIGQTSPSCVKTIHNENVLKNDYYMDFWCIWCLGNDKKTVEFFRNWYRFAVFYMKRHLFINKSRYHQNRNNNGDLQAIKDSIHKLEISNLEEGEKYVHIIITLLMKQQYPIRSSDVFV